MSPQLLFKPNKQSLVKSDEYDPKKSTISTEQMSEWLSAPISENIHQVPGLGAKNAFIMAGPNCRTPLGDSITTPQQLLGMFMYLKTDNVSSIDHCNHFYGWLKSKGIHGNTDSIVLACVEKCRLAVPGLYNEGEHKINLSLFKTKCLWLCVSQITLRMKIAVEWT